MSPAETEQGTQEWRDARCGFVTASRIRDVLRKPKRGQSDSTTRKAYLWQIAIERITGKPQEREFESYDLRRGKELEPFARVEYEMRKNVSVETAGFIEHPSIKFFGCSPDGLIGNDGLCQIKAPRLHVHGEYLEGGIVPLDYKPQMLVELACTGRKFNDFVSYNRDMPDHLQLFIVRLQRNEAEIQEVEAEVKKFLTEVEELIAKLPKPEDPLGITEEDVQAVK